MGAGENSTLAPVVALGDRSYDICMRRTHQRALMDASSFLQVGLTPH